MTEPINLNKARKAKAKAAERTRAAENRVRFGRTKAEKEAGKAEVERGARALDGAEREPERPGLSSRTTEPPRDPGAPVASVVLRPGSPLRSGRDDS